MKSLEELARKGTDKLLKRGEFLTFPVNPEVVAKYFLEVIQEAVKEKDELLREAQIALMSHPISLCNQIELSLAAESRPPKERL